MTDGQQPSLAALAAETGVPVPCAGNLPLDMGDPRFAWYVDEGAVDLFLVEYRDGVEQSSPEHLLRADAGRLLPGVAPQQGETTLGLVAKGLPGTALRRLPIESLGAIDDAELGAHVDDWITDVSATLYRDVAHASRADILITSEEAPDGWQRHDRVPPGCGVGVGGEEHGTVPGPGRSSGERWGQRRRAGRDPTHAGDLAFVDGRGPTHLTVLGSARRRRPPADGAERLSHRGARPGASQPQPRSRRPGEPGAGAGEQPTHRRGRRPAPPVQPLRPRGRVGCRSRRDGAAGGVADHRPPRGHRLQVARAGGRLGSRRAPRPGSRRLGRARPPGAPRAGRQVVDRQQRCDAGVPGRGRPPRGVAAGRAGALSRSRLRRAAQRRGHGQARRIAPSRRVAVLSAPGVRRGGSA